MDRASSVIRTSLQTGFSYQGFFTDWVQLSGLRVYSLGSVIRTSLQTGFCCQDLFTDWVQLSGLLCSRTGLSCQDIFIDLIQLPGLLYELGSIIMISLQTGHSRIPVSAVCHDHCCRTLQKEFKNLKMVDVSPFSNWRFSRASVVVFRPLWRGRDRERQVYISQQNGYFH